MGNEENKKPQNIVIDNSSSLGKCLYCFDRRAHNIRFYIKRHINSITVMFLLIYTILNIILAVIINSLWVSILIIVFLFFLGIERIILHLKLEIDKATMEKQENEINKKIINYELGLQNYISFLEEENNVLKRQRDISSIRLKELNKKSK